MVASGPRRWNGTTLLVADPSPTNDYEGPFDRRIDRPQPWTVAELAAALRRCSRSVIVIADPKELTTLIARHADSLVFPYWFGQSSRSRHAFVPSICEANDLMFVGADAFTKTICNDKELSKVVCRQAGLAVPRSVVVHSIGDLRHLRGIRFPAMVKPNYEGTSLGISDANRCATMAEVMRLVPELIDGLGQPVIIEDFVAGREFAVCMMADATGVAVRSGAWSIDGQEDFLDNRVYSYDFKVGGRADMRFEDATTLIGDTDLNRMRNCFDRLGKVDLLRVDGRVLDGRCCILELTPDIYLGSDGEFAAGFRDLYPAYDDFISAVVRKCLERYRADLPVGQ